MQVLLVCTLRQLLMVVTTLWLCKILWDNSSSQLLLPYEMCVCDVKCRRICLQHTPSKDSFTLWLCSRLLATVAQTDALNLWQDRMNCQRYISVSSCRGDAQHLTGFCWCGGGVGGRLARLSVCVGVPVCRCVSVCQQWRLQDVNTWGHTVSSAGWITARCAVVKNAAVFVSTPLRLSRNTDSDEWPLSHCRDCMGGQRDVRSGKPTQWNENVCS